MGKPTGFLEFTRELPGKRSVEERVHDYKEFINLYQPQTLNRQAARCMDCGVPFCQNGCPLGNIIPEFNDAVYRENWQEAYEILSATNNFPEFTGRICPAPCESACVLGINQPAITIEEIEKHIIEIAFEKNLVQPKKSLLRTDKKVAVIGSGPAGLAASAELNYAGHHVDVYERDDAPGGLLRYGIPDFKLEKWVLDRRIKLMENEGIVFHCNKNVGVNTSINDLLGSYDVVVLAGGSTVPRNLDIPGRGLKGVNFAMDFLKQNNKKVAGKNFLTNAIIESNILDHEVSATSKNVVVIGGGDTGSDCVGTSVRQGAVSVTQFELMPKPSANRTHHMPWPTYPMILKITSSHEEGVARHWAVATKAFIGDEKGNLKALKIVDLEWKISTDGKPAHYEEIKDSGREIPCELALLAMGFLHPMHEGMINELEIEKDERGNVKATDKKYQTNISKIFTCGDMRRGQSLVVWAIAEGRQCAKNADDFLMKSIIHNKML